MKSLLRPFLRPLEQAVEAALTRLFPKFSDADQSGWNQGSD